MILLVGTGGIVGIALFTLVLGMALGAFLTSWHFRKQIKENPPINENQIRQLYKQTGKKLSETQVQRIMRQIKEQN